VKTAQGHEVDFLSTSADGSTELIQVAAEVGNAATFDREIRFETLVENNHERSIPACPTGALRQGGSPAPVLSAEALAKEDGHQGLARTTCSRVREPAWRDWLANARPKGQTVRTNSEQGLGP
jgi:hypothetical protein